MAAFEGKAEVHFVPERRALLRLLHDSALCKLEIGLHFRLTQRGDQCLAHEKLKGDDLLDPQIRAILGPCSSGQQQRSTTMHENTNLTAIAAIRVPWNKGKLIGAKPLHAYAKADLV